MTAIETFAQFAVEASGSSLTEADRTVAKRAFLDTIGCMLLGAGAPVTQTVIEAAKGWGNGNAPVYGTNTRLPVPWAALANGASAHAYDLDDYTYIANDHPSAVLVPALLAAATTLPKEPVAGETLLDAYLVGLEIIHRVGETVNMEHYNLGWHTTSTIGSLGAAAAVARLIGLDAQQTAMAMALTPSMNAGYNSQFGTMGKPLHAGLSAKSGIVTTSLARAGATGYLGALDGKVSFATLLVPGKDIDFGPALAKLGNPWASSEYGLGAKLYPSCGYTHRAIDAALDVHNALGIESAEQVDTVTVSVPDFHLAILPFGVPKDPTEALFSIPYCAAVALATGGCRTADFVPEALERKDIMDLAGRIEVSPRIVKRPELNFDDDDPDTVDVRLSSGKSASATCGTPTGAPGKLLSDAELGEKFWENCQRHDIDAQRAAARAEGIRSAIDGLDQAATLETFDAALLA